MRDGSILLRLVHEAMLQMDIDVSSIYRKCGVTLSHTEDKQARLEHNANTAFWQAAEEVTQDPYIGLHIAEHIPLYKGQVLEYLFLSSASFGEGLQRGLSYQRLITDVAQSYLVIEEDEACLVLDTKMGDKLSHHFSECTMVGMIQFFRSLTDEVFKAKRIEFIYPEPADLTDYKRIFNCELAFNQSRNAICFDAQVLQTKSPHAEPELLTLHEKVAGEHLAKLEQQDMVLEVKRVVGELLEQQEVSLDLVAEKLGITARNLRSTLALADTSFNQILSEYRCLLAKRLLVRTNESVEEIVYLTGFSEPSTFYRAFKRWTDMTPIEYRKLKKGSRH
ncbi:MAG: AraC family transcriptional regulator [Bermanella sp.]